MKTMCTAALIAAGIAGTPALAQWDPLDEPTSLAASEGGVCNNDRATDLTWQIRREQRELDIDPDTARELRAEVDRTAALENHYCAMGMTSWRADQIDRRYAQIEEELRAESLG